MSYGPRNEEERAQEQFGLRRKPTPLELASLLGSNQRAQIAAVEMAQLEMALREMAYRYQVKYTPEIMKGFLAHARTLPVDWRQALPSFEQGMAMLVQRRKVVNTLARAVRGAIRKPA